MGRSGRAFVKYSIDCACTSGKLPSGTWLGTVYRCNHPGCECTGQTDCIHAVGKTGTEQKSDADQSKASDFDSTASKPTVCVPGIFRMQAFQQGEWIFAGEWCGTDWLADWVNYSSKVLKNRRLPPSKDVYFFMHIYIDKTKNLVYYLTIALIQQMQKR